MERRIILPGTGNYIEIIQASLKLIFQFSSIYIQNIIFSRLALKRFLFFSRAFLPIKRANRRYDSLEFLLSSSKLVYICFLGLKVLLTASYLSSLRVYVRPQRNVRDPTVSLRRSSFVICLFQ